MSATITTVIYLLSIPHLVFHAQSINAMKAITRITRIFQTIVHFALLRQPRCGIVLSEYQLRYTE